MTTFSNFLRPIVLVGLVAALFSCNNEAEKKEEPKSPDTSVTQEITPPAPPEFKPFDVLEVTHTVKDYAKWRPFFDADSAARIASGLKTIAVSRNSDNPNSITLVFEAADISKAKAFAADPRLKEVMTKGGVSSKPDIAFYKVIRFDPDPTSKEWVIITHRVKDFDAWLKVYDAEGKAARADQGLFDAVLTRGVEDPNIVHIVFDIKDKAKAKAAIASEEKKKLMMSAGVEGKPKIEFFKEGE